MEYYTIMRTLTLYFINKFRIHYNMKFIYSHLHTFKYLSINVVLCLDSSIFITDNSDCIQQMQSKHAFDKSQKFFRSWNTSLLILHSPSLQYAFTFFKCEICLLRASSRPRDTGWMRLLYYVESFSDLAKFSIRHSDILFLHFFPPTVATWRINSACLNTLNEQNGIERITGM
jgi:hypothetical protein